MKRGQFNFNINSVYLHITLFEPHLYSHLVDHVSNIVVLRVI